jgi:hypothetical protein
MSVWETVEARYLREGDVIRYGNGEAAVLEVAVYGNHVEFHALAPDHEATDNVGERIEDLPADEGVTRLVMRTA